jgi:hypothetical protein
MTTPPEHIINPPDDRRLLLLDPRDNVFTAVETLEKGTALLIGGERVEIPAVLPIGHKVARCHVLAGDKILKYGVSIGSATREIQPGEHVHTHNLQSDYLPTYTFEAERSFLKTGQSP